MGLWWWALGCFAWAFIVHTYLQTCLNYEIGARLLVLDQRLLETQKKREKDQEESNQADVL